jgi:hypothetical protein
MHQTNIKGAVCVLFVTCLGCGMSHLSLAAAAEATGKNFLWLDIADKHPTLLPGRLSDSHNIIQYLPCNKDSLEEICFLDVNEISSG